MKNRDTIALDADGVLLDYSLAYASLWERAFGYRPAERDRDAYSPLDRWTVERLEPGRLNVLRACMDEQFWSSIQPVELAVEACHRLHDAGYQLVCVTALAPQFKGARLRNLRNEGFPIERVIATGSSAGQRSPKADAIDQLAPLAFVDDYLPYFRGIASNIHRALIRRTMNGFPNSGPELDLVDSQYANLFEFSDWIRGPHCTLVPNVG